LVGVPRKDAGATSFAISHHVLEVGDRRRAAKSTSGNRGRDGDDDSGVSGSPQRVFSDLMFTSGIPAMPANAAIAVASGCPVRICQTIPARPMIRQTVSRITSAVRLNLRLGFDAIHPRTFPAGVQGQSQ
jgi:hypothetical protein